MQYIKVILASFFVLGILFLQAAPVGAASSSLVISEVQLGGAGTGTAGLEFVEIYNNSPVEIDVSGWCLGYGSASGVTQNNLLCIPPSVNHTKFLLGSHSHAAFVSQAYYTMTGIQADGVFTYGNGMAGTGGRVWLRDGAGIEIDRVAWGDAVGEATVAAPAGGKVLQRLGAGPYIDTDTPADFTITDPSLHYGGIYESVVDVCINMFGIQPTLPDGMIFEADGVCGFAPPPPNSCPNIADFQSTVPSGYQVDVNGNCQPDSCINLEGLQLSVPEFYDSDTAGNCYERDECPNIEGVQRTMPTDMLRNTAGDCVHDILPLELTEVMPNPAGADTGNEFIELYNPSAARVNLEFYSIKTGTSLNRTVPFPDGANIGPWEYKTFSDSEMKFSLTNTSGRVQLLSMYGVVFGDTGVYSSASDDMTWALIDGTWQFTNQPTPGQANRISIQEDEDEPRGATSSLAECPAGKYRNPLTNRCRNIDTDVAVMASCAADQYRNPETNRCRKITTASALAPCKDGQYRSEETNRCRNIATAGADLVPCKEGQERSPETNRCRKVASSTIPAASYAVKPVKDGAKAFVGWWVLGGVGAVALGYAVWEWRREVGGWVRGVRTFFATRRK